MILLAEFLGKEKDLSFAAFALSWFWFAFLAGLFVCCWAYGPGGRNKR